jgi:hypothetical protein
LNINSAAQAESLIRRALFIDEESFGPNHPNVASDLNNLAQLLQATNRLREAELQLRRALEILIGSLGSEHPSSRKVAANYCSLREAMGKTCAGSTPNGSTIGPSGMMPPA